MASILTTVILIVLFFVTGKIFEGFKRLIMLFFDITLKVLSLFGCHINLREPTIHTSKQFNETFGDIKIVKRSKHNQKIVPSIHFLSLTTLFICIALISINIITSGYISDWLYNTGVLNFIIKSKDNMDTVYIVSLFSIMSFSLARLFSHWRETKKYRVAKREMRLKQKAVLLMTSKELLDAAKEKDMLKINQLKEDIHDDKQ